MLSTLSIILVAICLYTIQLLARSDKVHAFMHNMLYYFYNTMHNMLYYFYNTMHNMLYYFYKTLSWLLFFITLLLCLLTAWTIVHVHNLISLVPLAITAFVYFLHGVFHVAALQLIKKQEQLKQDIADELIRQQEQVEREAREARMRKYGAYMTDDDDTYLFRTKTDPYAYLFGPDGKSPR